MQAPEGRLIYRYTRSGVLIGEPYEQTNSWTLHLGNVLLLHGVERLFCLGTAAAAFVLLYDCCTGSA